MSIVVLSFGALAVGREAVRARVRDDDLLGRDAEELDDVALRVLAVDARGRFACDAERSLGRLRRL